jgi:SAM-dependent methyltransferase
LSANPTWHAEDSSFKASQVKQAIERSGITPRSIVEVGCGAGGIVAELARAYPSVPCVGFEVSEDAHGLCAQHRASNLKYVLGSFVQADEEVDLLVCCDVFEHVDDYVGFIRALGAKARHLIFNIPLDLSVANILFRRLDHLRGRYGHLHYFTRETALATLEHAGLKVRTEFLAAGGIARAVTARKRLAAIPRMIVGAISPELSCRLMGGYSLVVVADGSPSSGRPVAS